ncbi:hypothetical protein [Bacillus sp. UNC41MFS5]|nr:hypothetical protein [Bacillus sp. UNC41MFS5]
MDNDQRYESRWMTIHLLFCVVIEYARSIWHTVLKSFFSKETKEADMNPL